MLEQKIVWVKREQISKIAYRSIRSSGRHPELFSKIVLQAIETLKLMIEKIFKTEVQKLDLRLEMRTNALEMEREKEMPDKAEEEEQTVQKAVQMPQN